MKTGSPTGTMYAKVYAITGTYGTDATPTGAALATSDGVDVASLTTSYNLITFTFSGANRITLTADTYYAVIVEYAGGDSSNYLRVGADNSSPSHDGNRIGWSNSSSTWSASSTTDVCFYVYIEAASASRSVSPSASVSASASRSISPSASVSASPSPGANIFYAGSGDGMVWYGNSVFNTAVTTTTGSAASTTDQTNTCRVWYSTWYYIDRLFFQFDTSALPDTAVIDSVTFSVYVESIGWSGEEFGLVQNTTASNTTLVTADYGKCGTPEGATEGASRVSITTTGWKTFTFNATGRSWVNRTGYTKIGIRPSQDLQKIWSADGGATFRMSEYADPAYKPYLTITYSNPSGSASASRSVSPSASISPSISPSASVSRSVSRSVSPSGSASPSPSVSPSPSASLSPSRSVSRSISPSASVSKSVSRSISPSTSVSKSSSSSASRSASSSISASPSPSPSLSPSLSPSQSPSLGTEGYLLDYYILPKPKQFSRSYIQIKTDVTSINGKLGRDLGGFKEKYLLSWENLTKDEVDRIIGIVNKNTAVDFFVLEDNLQVPLVSVLLRISSIEYTTLGSDYLSSLSLELEEVE